MRRSTETKPGGAIRWQNPRTERKAKQSGKIWKKAASKDGQRHPELNAVGSAPTVQLRITMNRPAPASYPCRERQPIPALSVPFNRSIQR